MFGWLKRRHITLVAMRLADMHRVHPDMVTVPCARCHHALGVYPSGQLVMRRYGKRLDVVCSVCQDPGPNPTPAPGALGEVGQSVRRS